MFGRNTSALEQPVVCLDGRPLAEDSLVIDAGLDFNLSQNATAGVSYSGQFGDGVQDNAVKGRLTWLF